MYAVCTRFYAQDVDQNFRDIYYCDNFYVLKNNYDRKLLKSYTARLSTSCLKT